MPKKESERAKKIKTAALRAQGIHDVNSFDKGRERMKDKILIELKSSKESKINQKRNGRDTIEILIKQIKRII